MISLANKLTGAFDLNRTEPRALEGLIDNKEKLTNGTKLTERKSIHLNEIKH